MSKKKVGSSHRGGQQLPLLVPTSEWTPPTELPDLRHHSVIGLDTEERDDGLAKDMGPGWATGDGYVCGVSAAWPREGGGFDSGYYPIAHPDTECFSKERVARWIKDHADAGVRLCFHSAGYDLGWIRRDLGLDLKSAAIDDTVAMAVQVDENRNSYRLDDLCAWKGVGGKDEALLKEAAAAYDLDPKSGLWRMPARYVGPYAGQDPAATLGLREALWPTILAERTVDAYQLEMDLVPLVLEMRLRGVRVDVGAAERAIVRIRAKRDEVLSELARRLAVPGVTVENVRSVQWLETYHDREQVDYPKHKAGKNAGRGTFTKDWMSEREHWLPKLCSKASQLHRCSDLFLQEFILGYQVNGRIHATVNQYRGEDGDGTRTTRLSYSDPPLQQMPAREEELAAMVRGCFVPESGEKYLAADYSQQELRLMVHFASAPKVNLSRAAEARALYIADPDTDFHQLVISWTGLARKPAKNATFAKAFGAGVPKFALMIGKPVEAAKVDMAKYDQEMPFVQELSDFAQRVASERGYILLLDGARSHFDSWEAAWVEKGEEWHPPCSLEKAREHWGTKRRLRRADTRKGMSRLIQGSAARQTKLAMRACWREGFVPLVQMHDELGWSIGNQAHGKQIVQLMRDAAPLRVPNKVDEDYGVNWGEASHDLPKGQEYKKLWENVEAAA